MPRSTVKVENLRPGMVVYAEPGPLIVPDVLTSQSLSKQRKDKHPLIVLSVDSKAQKITVTYIASFHGALNLAGIALPGGNAAKQLFVPIIPAEKEFTHDPIAWESHPKPIPAGWASVRSKTVLTGAEFKTFDDDKYFTKETAAELDAMIHNVV